MSRSNLIITSILGLAVSAVPAAAQSEESPAKNEVSVQAFGSFVKSTTQQRYRQQRYQQRRRPRQLPVLLQRSQRD